MPVLSNSRHERFAQELAKGKPATRAYEAAGYTSSNNAACASRLQRDPAIVARLAEILDGKADIEAKAVAKAAETLAIDKAWVMGKLVENVERSMQARPVLDAEGTETGEYRYEGSVANRALELLGKEFGMFIDRKEVRVGALDVLNADDRDRVRDAVRRELERRVGGAGSAGEPRQDKPIPAIH